MTRSYIGISEFQLRVKNQDSRITIFLLELFFIFLCKNKKKKKENYF
jgi:hypothetical protein